MQKTFVLSRDDFAEIHKRTLARARAHLRRGAAAQRQRLAATPPRWWQKVIVWFVVAWIAFAYFRWAGAVPHFGTHVAAAMAGAAVGVIAVLALARRGSRKLCQAMVADDGWFLSPQTIEVTDACIKQRSVAALTRWRWEGFRRREESPTLIFLFVDNAVCLVLPKAGLSADARALIEQRVPL